jgi:hypothetical protein
MRDQSRNHWILGPLPPSQLPPTSKTYFRAFSTHVTEAREERKEERREEDLGFLVVIVGWGSGRSQLAREKSQIIFQKSWLRDTV